jgi:Kef-type K+ transport system membrane component KefB
VAGLVQALRPELFLATFGLILFGGVAGSRWSTRYYQRTFGAVRPSEPIGVGERYFMGMGGVSVGTQILLGAAAVGVGLCFAVFHWPPQIVLGAGGLLGAGGALVYLRRSQTLPQRPYWVVGDGLLIVASLALIILVPLVPRFHGDSGFVTAFGLYLAVMGAVVAVCGALDHRLLVRSFASVAKTHHAATV